MSQDSSPIDPASAVVNTCRCGQHASELEHDLLVRSDPAAGPDAYLEQVVQASVVRALFPQRQQRRALLSALGQAGALAAISAFFPLGAATALAAEGAGAPEKKQINIGFLPITCATPILLGQILGYYEKQGLQVKLHKAAGWPAIKDKTVSTEFDASHMLAPMALGLRLGVGGPATTLVAPLLENLNGSSLVLGTKHKGNRDPKQWKGMTIAVPSDLSVQNILLREYLMQHGLDPNSDLKIKAMPPAEMMSNLRGGEIDGFLGAEPFGQRAVHDGIGFIHLLSAELWDGHPCCVFATSERLLKEAPNTFAALFRSIVQATIYTDQAANWPRVTSALAAPDYLNQPVPVIEQVLTGKYADGLGNNKSMPRRVAFEPFPWQSMAVWLLHELKRWGYLKKEVDFKQIAESVFLAADARKHMLDAGVRPGKSNSRRHVILGKDFDPERPEVYFNGLAPAKTS